MIPTHELTEDGTMALLDTFQLALVGWVLTPSQL